LDALFGGAKAEAPKPGVPLADDLKKFILDKK
jgi:hypothetical protein